ncbi:MAG TPA: glycosyltransferase family 2 protein [Candidatus Krumholzibacteria bacterium]|nr:glycosyltransferase family 2 protein [Candidatus Krumholzibacteria bacterium]
MRPTPDLSVVVPALNEADSLPELVDRIAQGAAAAGVSHEVWIIDDGSTDATEQVLESLQADHPEVHAVLFTRNYGKAAALSAGFAHARGARVITMDADLQDDPAEIPALLATLDQGWDLVSGWKQDRKDGFIKNKTSKVFNGVTGRAVGLRLHDFNCGLKAYRREVCESVRVYGEMHRYIPAQAHLQGFRVTELPVRHHRRKHGVTKYGANRFLNGFLDLLTLLFLSRRGSSPLHLFGRMGALFATVGGAILLYFLGWWLTGHGLRIRPLMLLAVTLIILAVQFVSLGLVAELVVAGQRPEADFRVRRTL